MDEEIMFADDVQEVVEEPAEQPAVPEIDSRIKVLEFIGKANIISDIDEEELPKIYNRCFEGYKCDEETRRPRNEALKEANKMAMQILDPKSYPWQNCANVKLPLITTGAIDFASKIYPAVVQDDEVVRCKIVSEDNDEKRVEKMKAGNRLATYLNWQLLEKMDNWREDEDMLTYALPINGIMLKKIYYDVVDEKFCSDLVFPENFFTPNDTRNIDTAERVTHVYQMSTEDIISSLRSKVFGGFSVDELKKDDVLLDQGDGGVDNEIAREEDKVQEGENRNVWTVCEQHCWIDLDKDGYREPYIVTFIPQLEKVVRITARYDERSIKAEGKDIIKITPIPYFTKYSFLQSPDGSFYSLGLGELLLPINEAANTVTNQLLDAGTLNNLPAGWISKSAKLAAGDMNLRPGEFKQVNSFMGKIQDSIMLLPTKEPSATLFELLKNLIDSANSIASVKDLTNTDFPSNSSVITTLSIIENGMSPFKAIYKRFHAALTKEVKLLAYWMDKYADMDEYARVSGNMAVPQDFKEMDVIVPVSDPSLVTSTQKMGRAQFLDNLIQSGNPAIDVAKVTAEELTLMGVDPTTVMAEPTPPNPTEEEMLKLQIENLKAQIAEIYSRVNKNNIQSEAEIIRANSEDTKRTADSVLALANAEEKQSGLQNQQYINELLRAKEGASAYVEDKLKFGQVAQKELPEGK